MTDDKNKFTKARPNHPTCTNRQNYEAIDWDDDEREKFEKGREGPIEHVADFKKHNVTSLNEGVIEIKDEMTTCGICIKPIIWGDQYYTIDHGIVHKKCAGRGEG